MENIRQRGNDTHWGIPDKGEWQTVGNDRFEITDNVKWQTMGDDQQLEMVDNGEW